MSNSVFLDFDRGKGYPTRAEWMDLVSKAKAKVKLNKAAATSYGEEIVLNDLNDELEARGTNDFTSADELVEEITAKDIDDLPEAKRPTGET